MVIQIMLRAHKAKKVFSQRKKTYVTALAQIKCLKQITYQRLLLTCAPIHKLPSDINTMNFIKTSLI